MSMGELFDFARPALLFLSIILSTLVLRHALRKGLSIYASVVWAVATLLLPLIILPIYFLVQLNRARPGGLNVPASRARVLIPLIYAASVLAILLINEYHYADEVEAHLARATQAKLAGDRRRTITEYRAALASEDNAHTRKLLAIALSDAGDWELAVSEFRLAERGGEPDDTIPFRIGEALDALNQRQQATIEYTRFLQSEACVQTLPDNRCQIAKTRITAGHP